MPAGMLFVWRLLVSTRVPLLLGMKTSVDQVGSFMSPVAGGDIDGSGMTSYSGRRAAGAAASPLSRSVTVDWKAAFLDTGKLGPEIGVEVVVRTTKAAGGVMEKSGISITVPLYSASSTRSPTAYAFSKLPSTMAESLPDITSTWSFGSAGVV